MSLRDLVFCCFRLNTPFGYLVYARLHIGVLAVLVVFGGVTCIGVKTQNTMSLRDTAFSVLRLNT